MSGSTLIRFSSADLFLFLALFAGGSAVAEEPVVRYVWAENPAPAAPYLSWATAARTIQDAIDAAESPGEQIVVTNGVYGTGGRVARGAQANRVAVTKPLIVRSVNGAAVTIIQGRQQESAINGPNAMRCVYLAEGAVLIGFTLTNGATLADGSFNAMESDLYQTGGGVWSESSRGVVSNCVFTGCAAEAGGGGAAFAILNGCTLATNSTRSFGGGAFNSVMNDCMFIGNSAADGGGASYCTLSNCVLTGNSAAQGGGAAYATLNSCQLNTNSAAYGGGALWCTLSGCLLTGNRANNIGADYGWGGGIFWGTANSSVFLGNSSRYGGGAMRATLNNCTLVGNSANQDGEYGGYGGGASYCELKNSILYYNTNSGPSENRNYHLSNLDYCCTTPLSNVSLSHFANAPLFVDMAAGDLRLQSNSPCVNFGLNTLVVGDTDASGLRRVAGGTVDIGAYEFQSAPIPNDWLLEYGLPLGGPVESEDPDGDGLNNWEEWRCDTNPRLAQSALRLLSPITTGSDVILTWESVSGRSYILEQIESGGSSAQFELLVRNIPGQSGTTSYTNRNANPAVLYRVGIE
jgi:hypothetical protein